MKRYVLFGAGNEGYKLSKRLGQENIRYFVDNDLNKQGKSINGISVLSPHVLREDCIHEVYITVSGIYYEEIYKQLESLGIVAIPGRELIKKYEFLPNPKIQKLKNLYQGKRCFIIGSGPSLKVADLKKLKKFGEITFGANKIFKIFRDTTWRPDLYCVLDYKVFSAYYNEICSLESKYIFMSDLQKTDYFENFDSKLLEGDNKYIFNTYVPLDPEKNGIVEFSSSADRYIVEGWTVIYAMLQIAFYLGFHEIYLLGVDFNYSDMEGTDKEQKDHFCKDYMKQGELVNPPRPELNLSAYKTAELYSKSHNFKIFNASRNSRLEVFEKVNFDTLF